MTFHLFSICQRASSTVTATNVPTSSPTPSSTSSLSSLNSPPIYNTCPPGNCQFGPDAFLPVPLLQNIPITNTTFLLRFGLPDPQTPLNLSTCACLLAGVEIDGEMVVRPYTPISTNAQKGTFDLLMRKYPQGKMSSYLSQLSPSKEKSNADPVLVGFKHIPFNVKIQYPFASSSSSGKIPKVIAMICGGTGITPMIQALHALLGDSKSATEQVIMLYGSRNQKEILAREMLDDWSSQSHGKFHVTHVLSHEEGEILLPPEDFDEKESSLGLSSTHRYSCVKKGYIDRALIESVVPPATHGEDILIFVCGPPIMYDVLCGPRDKKEVTGVLGEMGYSQDQVYKF